MARVAFSVLAAFAALPTTAGCFLTTSLSGLSAEEATTQDAEADAASGEWR